VSRLNGCARVGVGRREFEAGCWRFTRASVCGPGGDVGVEADWRTVVAGAPTDGPVGADGPVGSGR